MRRNAFQKILAYAVGVSICSLLAEPAASDEFTESLSAIRRATEGYWTGVVRGSDASGESFEAEDAFTFVVTSDDGLNSATWSTDALEIATYERDGIYRIRNWNRSGGRNEIQYELRIEELPDASGNGEWVLVLEQTASDGTVMETLEHFSLDGDAMRMLIEMRPQGSDEPFETVVTGSWTRSVD
jgi:hypothetical protein